MALFSRKKDSSPRSSTSVNRSRSSRSGAHRCPCPQCSGRGYLDHIDPYREVMFQHCTECFAKYEVTRAELGADDTTDAFTI